MPGRVLTGGDSHARRGADRRCYVELLKPHTLRRERVDVRRCDGLVPITAEVAVAQVVDEHEHDVGPLVGDRSGRQRRQQDEDADRHCSATA